MKRVFVVIMLLLSLLVIELVTEDTILLNLPTEEDIFEVLLEEQKQVDKMLESYQGFSEVQSAVFLEEQAKVVAELNRLEEERLEQLQDELDEVDPETLLYTLEDRDKVEDYQNLFDPSVKHVFVVNITQAEWDNLNDEINEYHDKYNNYKSNYYAKTDVTYMTEDETIEIKDVGLRTKGNNYSRWGTPDQGDWVAPMHYTLKFNETFDLTEGTEAYTLLKTREVFDLEKLYFKWNRNNDQSAISETYSYKLFRDAGVPCPNSTLAVFDLRVNGETVQYSLSTVIEAVDEEFVRKTLQETPTKEVGDLYKVIWPGTLEPLTTQDYYFTKQVYPSYYDQSKITYGVREWEYNYRPTYGKETNEDIFDYQNLIDFTQNLDQYSQEELKTYFDTHFDVDTWLKTLAISVFLGNPDDYRSNVNNYYLYFDENNYMTYIPFDFDHSLGQGWNGGDGFINYSLGNDIYTWKGSHNPTTPLVEKVLEIEEYQIIYENYLEQFINDKTFSFLSFTQLFGVYKNVYGDDFDMTNDKYYYFTTKIENVLDDIEYYRNKR